MFPYHGGHLVPLDSHHYLWKHARMEELQEVFRVDHGKNLEYQDILFMPL